MIFMHDTRDKPGKHENVERWLETQGHKIVRSKMYVGDITLLHDQSICVDLKQGLPEVESNLIHQHSRFRNECKKAMDSGIRLIVLVEESGIDEVESVAGWVNPRRARWERIDRAHSEGKMLNIQIPAKPPAGGETICRQMKTMNEKYGVEWAFCAKESTGRKVCELLNVPILPEAGHGVIMRRQCVSEWKPGRFVSR